MPRCRRQTLIKRLSDRPGKPCGAIKNPRLQTGPGEHCLRQSEVRSGRRFAISFFGSALCSALCGYQVRTEANKQKAVACLGIPRTPEAIISIKATDPGVESMMTTLVRDRKNYLRSEVTDCRQNFQLRGHTCGYCCPY